MDLINSQNHSKSNNSFGLIDENLMNNLSLGGGFGGSDESGTSQTFKIKEKPPIPNKKTTPKQPFGNISNSQIPTYPHQFQQQLSGKFTQLGEQDNFNSYDEQVGDATVESVKFNDDDLAELEYNNSSSEEDEDEEENEQDDDENKENTQYSTKNKDIFEPKRVEIENSLFENVPKLKKFHKLDEIETNGMKVNYFSQSSKNLNDNNINAIQKLDLLPEKPTTINDDLNTTPTNFQESINQNNNDSIMNQNNEPESKNDSFYNTSQNITRNEQINQLVMQSVERLKRIGMNAEVDINNSLTNHFLNLQNPVKSRFSSSSIRTVNSNLKMLNQNENEDLGNSKANLTNIESSFNQDFLLDQQTPICLKSNKFLDSKYFKPGDDLTESSEPSFITNNNPIIQVNGNRVNTTQSNNNQSNIFDNEFDPSNQANFISDINDLEFKSCNEFIEMLDKDEYDNKKEFELSVAINDNDKSTSATNIGNSGPSSASSTNSGGNAEKWWNNLNAQQMSKLELSNLSYLSNTLNDASTTPCIAKFNQVNSNRQVESSNTNNKVKIDVGDYFNRKSDMPEFLADKKERVIEEEHNQNENTLIQSIEETQNHSILDNNDKSNTNKEKSKSQLEAINENSITFSSPSNFNSLAASGFSFTLNATGDFIEDLKNKKPTTTSSNTPFQLTKMLQKQQNQQQMKSTNLKAIAEDLNRVSSRLANTNLTSEDGEYDEEACKNQTTTSTILAPSNQKLISDPLLSSSIKSSISNTNLKNLINMDETLSSISSANIGSISSNNITKKSNESTSNNKQTGSLTSTPSKHKSSRISNKSSNANDKSSAQDSFISSIPERNDSTLVGNHHQQPIYSKNHHKHQRNSITSNLNSKNKKQKNAEIQTTPSSNNKITNDDLNKNSRISLSSVSNNSANNSNDSTANLLASQITAFNNLAASLNSNNTSTNSSTLTNTQMVPFTFLPAGVVIKYLEEMQTSMKTNFENISKLSVNNQSESSNSKFFSQDTVNSGTPISSADSTLTTTSSIRTKNSSKITNNIAVPIIELDKNSIDFGMIAEGCNNTLRVIAKLTQESFKNVMEQKKDLNYTSYLQIEYDYSNDWTIEPFDLQTNKIITSSSSLLKKKLNDSYARSKFIQTLTLHNDKSTIDNSCSKNINHYNINPEESNSILKYDFISSYYEFFINLNTINLNFFKEIIQKSNDPSSNQIEPILIKTNIYIYYCVKSFDNNLINSHGLKKYLLNRIDLKYLLGYARLRTTATIDSIEFELTNLSNKIDDEEEGDNDRTLSQDNDKTLSNINDMNMASNDLNKTLNLDQYVPLTNYGNINIDVSCFMSNNEYFNRQKLIFKNYELRLNDPLISFDARSKLKRYVHLNLTKLYNDATSLKNDDYLFIANLINNSNSRLIVQVKPNGLIHEIPIKVKIKSSNLNDKDLKLVKENEIMKLEKQITKQVQKTDPKIASSKTIYFFSKSLNKPNNMSGNEDEITIKNLNSYEVKCCLTVIKTSHFKFSNEILKNNKNSIKLNDQFNEIQFSLDAQQQISIKIQFDHSGSILDSNIISDIAKLKVNGLSKTYKFNLIGFRLNESILNIENANKIDKISESLTKIDECLMNREIKIYKYYVDMMNTNSQSNRLIYRKVLNIDTKTFNTKCILYPFMYDLASNKQIVNSSKQINDLCYDLKMENNIQGRLRLILNDLQVNKLGKDLEWIEFKPNNCYQINLELMIMFDGINPLNSLNLDMFQIGLFWIEYDLNLYCVENVKRVGITNPNLLPNSNLIDSILNKLITNTCLINANNMNDSIASSRSSNFSFQTDDVASSVLNESKLRMSKDDKSSYVRLLRQSLKCSILKLRLKPILIDNKLAIKNQLPEVLFVKKQPNNINDEKSILSDMALNNSSLKNDSIVSISSQTYKKPAESWSIKPDKLVIETNPIKNESQIYILTLKNNLSRKPLGFDIKYLPKYLTIQPVNGILEPSETIEIKVLPIISALNNIPWYGTICVWCNNIQRDVSVSILPRPDTNELSTVEQKRENNTVLNNISTFSLPHVSSSSTPYNHSASAPTILSSKSGIEQGFLGQSEITQYTITHDSIPMTPLLNTSLISDDFERSDTSKLIKEPIPPTPPLRLYRMGTDTKVEFPPSTVGKTRTCHLALSNPTNTYVNWKVYCIGPAFLRSNNNPNDLIKSNFSIFTLSPMSGIVPPLQKIIIKIDFTPKEALGEFTQNWKIDTRISDTNLSDSKTKDDSMIYGLAPFNCQLVTTGKCIQSCPPNDNFNRFKLSDRIIKAKLPSTSDVTMSVLNKNSTTANISKLSSLINKESSSLSTLNSILTDKSYNNSNKNSTLSLVSSILSNTTSSNTSKINRLILKSENIDFPDTEPNQLSKGHLTINNKEDFDCKIKIMLLHEPFYCKYTEMKVNSRHYIKVPIEFRPKTVGDYSEKMLIKVDEYESPLTCVLKAKCVKKI